MNEAACRPELLTTAMVALGVGMGRFAGRSALSLYVDAEGGWTGEKLDSGDVSGWE